MKYSFSELSPLAKITAIRNECASIAKSGHWISEYEDTIIQNLKSLNFSDLQNWRSYRSEDSIKGKIVTMALLQSWEELFNLESMHNFMAEQYFEPIFDADGKLDI